MSERPKGVPATAAYEKRGKVWRDSGKQRLRLWSSGGLVLLDAGVDGGKLHGGVYWNLHYAPDAGETEKDAEARVAIGKELGIPQGPTIKLRAVFDHGELRSARFVIFDETDTRVDPKYRVDELRAEFRDGKLHGAFEWRVGPCDPPLLRFGEESLNASIFKVPKPWPQRVRAVFDQGKLVSKELLDKAGKRVGEAPPALVDWGQHATREDVDGYITKGRFLADAGRFFAGKPRVASKCRRTSTKWIDALPLAHRAGAKAFDALVKKKQLPLLGSAFDLTSFGFNCVAEELDGANDARWVGIASDGSGNMFLLDIETGKVHPYDHDGGGVSKSAFASLDELAFAMLRIEAAVSKRIPAKALRAAFRRLKLPAAERALELAVD